MQTKREMEEQRKNMLSNFDLGREKDLEELFCRIGKISKDESEIICANRKIIDELRAYVASRLLPPHGPYESFIQTGIQQHLGFIVRFKIYELSVSEIDDWFRCYNGEGSLPDYCYNAEPHQERLSLMKAFWNTQRSEKRIDEEKRVKDTIQKILYP